MIPVYAFCQQQFRFVTLATATVEQLLDHAPDSPVGAADLELFVVHDPDHGAAVLVEPSRVRWLVRELGLLVSLTAAESGLFDLLRQGQVAVSRNLPASLVGRIIDRQQLAAVVAVGADGVPVGVLLPEVLRRRLPDSHGFQRFSAGLQQSLRALAPDTGWGEVLRAIEAEETDFHSESINLNAADPYVCPGNGDGPHLISFRPCQRHPGAAAAVARRLPAM